MTMRLKRIDSDMAETAVIAISILKSISTMHGKESVAQFMPFEPSWDIVQDLFFTALQMSGNYIWGRYYEDDGCEVVALRSDDMTDYHRLAYRFGELSGLPQDENQYLNDSFRNLHNTLGAITSYSFGFRLQQNSRRKPKLMLIFTPEFYPNAEVIYQLYQLFGYYTEMLPVLQSEVRGTENSKQKQTKRKELKAA